MTDPVTDIQVQLEAMKRDLDKLKAETVGDRNQIEKFKQTLRGRIEAIEASTLRFVSQDDHDELKEAVQGLSSTVNKATNVLNKAVTVVLTSVLGALGVWLFVVLQRAAVLAAAPGGLGAPRSLAWCAACAVQA